MTEKIGTKDRIIDIAIGLFAQKGYHETSVRDIAKEVGIHYSSIYSHFENKEMILSQILEIYKNQVNQVQISDEMLECVVAKMSPGDLLIAGIKRIADAVSSEKINKINTILLIEMFRNSVIRDFFNEWYFDSNRKAVSRLFQKMMDLGKIKNSDPDLLSSFYNNIVNAYYQELYLLKADQKNTEHLEKSLEKQILFLVDFIKKE